MIKKEVVSQIVNEWMEGKDYFLTDLSVSPDNRIVIEMDHDQGVWIDDCVDLSRFVESRLNRDEEDYELEVGSAGIGQPFKVLRQYLIHIGDEVETLTAEGRKLRGILTAADEEGFTISCEEKVREEGEKRPKLRTVEHHFRYGEVKYTKYQISFK
ncbi:MAG: ribosome assembly cofactor RimP [Bacteroidaceae bacterium]|jgi:ribosome maturation factor RimP